MSSCVICGKELPARSKKFCHNCRYVTFACYGCGKQVTTSRSKYLQLPGGSEKTNHFCSRRCAIGYGSKIAAVNRENKIDIVCPNCGKVNKRKKAHSGRPFCNRKCFFEYRKANQELYPGHKPTGEELANLKKRTGKNNPAYGRTGDKCPQWKGGRESYRGKG